MIRSDYHRFHEAHGLIYMALAEDVGLVKIGTSLAPSNRCAPLRRALGHPVVLIAETPGSFAIERRVHIAFEKHRACGEWFHWNFATQRLASQIQRTGKLPRRFYLPADRPQPPHQP